MNGSRIFNFSPADRAPWLVSVAIVCLIIATAGPASGQSPDAEVAQIVKELKSDRFEARQQATRKLFQLGPEILPALEKIERSASVEQNRRLENLKVVFRAISSGQNSPVARRAWLDFKDVGFDTRDRILEKLLDQKEYEAHFALLEQLEPLRIGEVFEDNNNYYSQVVELCRSEQWDVIDSLLSMPLMWKYQPRLCARYHFLMGTLENQVTQLRKRLDERGEAEQAGALVGDLRTVVKLLVFQRQYDAAARYIAKIPQERARLKAENQLLMDRGDWKELAKRAVFAEADFDKSQPHIACSPWEYVLLKQYGQGVQAGIKAIDEIEAQQRDNGTVDKGLLAALSMLTCDWEKALTEVELKQDIWSVRLLFSVNRHKDSEELIGAGKTFESRTKWAADRREEIGKLIEKIERELARPNRGNSAKLKSLTKDARTKTEYFLFVCQTWLEFGLEAEAILYLREAYLQLHDVVQLADVKKTIVNSICDPSRSDATWSFLKEAGYSDSQLASLAGSGELFGNRKTSDQPEIALAQFLNSGLYESVKDPKERLQRICFLLNSEFKPTNPETVKELYPQGFDLDAELGRVNHQSTRNSCWQISQIYQRHQRHREALQWKQLAALKGHPGAVFSLAEDALEEGEFVKAARMFDAHFAKSSKPYSLGLSSHARKMAGDEQKARQRMFFASVIPQHYDSSMTNFYNKFIRDERGHWVSDLARLDTLIVETPINQKVQLIATAMSCSKWADPVESANFGKRRLLEFSAGNSVREYFYVSREILASRTSDVMAAVEERDFDAVKSIFDQVNQFSLGSPALVEKIVPRLDELGQTELADYITDQTSLYFEEVLVKYPHSANNRNNYAWLLACARRRLDTVLRHAEMAVQLQPQEHTYIDTLAESHFVRGELDEAIATIKRSIALDPPRRYYRNQLKKYQNAKAGK